jgi:molecular chaperone DnaJ
MGNPYEVLEVKEGSSKEDIKKSYRELAKKYHPDQYTNNPLKDLAEDKMRELNEAYDYLMKNSGEGNFKEANSSGFSAPNNYENSSSSSLYSSIRMNIQNGNLSAAENSLNNISEKGGEWCFLMGFIQMQRGHYDTAFTNITKACNLEPNNMEYRQAFNKLNNSNNSYRQTYYNRGNGNDDMCDMCFKLWCLENICECFQCC